MNSQLITNAPIEPAEPTEPTEPTEPAEPTDSTDSTDSMTIILARIQIIIKILARSALISTPQEWQNNPANTTNLSPKGNNL